MRSALSRRALFGYTAAAAVAGSVGIGPKISVPYARANSLGTLLDYSGGVPSAAAIAKEGHLGVIRYVSDRRPEAGWMTGKPLLAKEVEALNSAGLRIVSCYQYGKGETADWRGGAEAGKRHAERGLELHLAAGGPENVPIYASIDDKPSRTEFDSAILPYLRGWESVVGKENTGVYANAPTLELTRLAGVGAWFWQHDWGTPEGHVHPAAHLHQFEIDKRTVDGVGVDLNSILADEYGAW